MNSHIKNLIQFNFAMLIMSTSGTFGRLIHLPPGLTIWLRCVFGAITLFFLIFILKYSLRLHKKHVKNIFISSVFLGVHWVTYFYSLQVSNVAIAMLSLFTYPVFTSLLEPLVLKTKFLWSNLLLGIVVLIGVSFMIPELSIENDYTMGIIIGLISAVLYSFRNLILKKHISQYPGTTLMFYQLAINSVLLIPMLFIFSFDGLANDLPYVVLLSLFTTAIGHTMFVMSFKKFSISTASIMSSLQPLFGIIIAFLFLHEVPAMKTFIGGGLILITVVIESLKTGTKD